MKEVGGGSDDLVLVLGRTQKTVKTFLKKKKKKALLGVTDGSRGR